MEDLWDKPEITRSFSKAGQGAFTLDVHRDGRVRVKIGDGAEQDFIAPRPAYDHCRQMYDTTSDHAYWNVCYHLEDYLPKSAN